MLVAGQAVAQQAGPESMDAALASLRQSTGLALVLRGEDRTAQRVIPFAINTYYIPATERTAAKLEMWSYRLGRLDRQWVADSENFIRYDAVQNQYSITPYKTTPELLKLLQTMGGGTVATPVRLLKELIEGQPWQPWIRQAKVTTPTPFEFTLSAGDPVRNRFSFRFAEPFNPESPQLKDISGEEIREGLHTVWTVQIFSNFSPGEVRFRFEPPRGAKPVAGPASVKSGT